MKKIECILLLITATALAQTPAPKQAPVPATQAPTPTFTHLEEAMVKEINTRHDELQQLVFELMDEVKRAHPGYEFNAGRLVPIPPPASKAKEEKKP
jgi:hypothetical protein